MNRSCSLWFDLDTPRIILLRFPALGSEQALLGRGAKANEKRLEGWQKNQVRRLTFKEQEQKVYPFLDEDVPNILEQLLQMKLIELLECKWLEDMGKVDDPNYCKYHRIIGHPI